MIHGFDLLLAVVDQDVDGAVGDTRQDARETRASNGLAETIGSLTLAQEVGSEASNVRRGHGRAGQGVALTTGNAGEDIDTGGEDIDDSAKVGEVGNDVLGVRGADGAGAGLGGGGALASVGGLVTGSDGEEDSGLDDGGGGVVDSLGEATAQRHVGNSAVGALAGSGILGNELDTGDDTAVGAGTTVVEDLDGEELGLLGDTEGQTADGAGNVGTVALAIGIAVISKVLEPLGAALELGVLNVNASVDDIGTGALASGLVEGVGGATGLGRRDTGKTPRSILLGSLDGDDGILLNVVDLKEEELSERERSWHISRKGAPYARVVAQVGELIGL